MTLLKNIYGAGGGGSSSTGSRAAIEDPDSLQSRAMLQILELLGEGQIGGLVAGAQSIFLNDTPLMNADGSYNIPGVAWDFRDGTQDQLPMPGFDDINTPFTEGVQVKVATPHTVTITNPNANQVRVIVSLPSLMSQDGSTGDVHGTTVQYKFSLSSRGGPFVDVPADYAWSVGGSWALVDGHLVATPLVSATGLVAKAMISGEGTMSVQPQYELGGVWNNIGAPVALDVVDGAGNIGVSATGPSGGTRLRFVVIAMAGVPVPVYPSYDPLGQAGSIPIGVVAGPPPTLSGGEISSYTPVPTCTINDKTRSRYQRAHLIQMAGDGPWQLRMTRLTADTTSSMLQNDTYFDSYVEIVNTRMNYPNSVLAALSIDSSLFNSIPNRAYLVDGLYIRVPSNYNPVSRAYTGIWDGTFKLAVSNNPAWVLYDLLTNRRYGLGQYLSADQIDAISLYRIGRYCDELVSDGLGGVEPRFTCNTAIQTQAEAYKLIGDICSVMFGMAFWDGSQVSFMQDAPADPEMGFSPANVVDGIFTYTGSARKDRHSVALVAWNDPAEYFKQKIEYVENPEMIARYGVRKIETVAFGCTSRGQAHRVGKRILYTEQYESDLVQFKVGLDAALVGPGNIIRIHDPYRAGKRMSGRLASCTTFNATLDAPVTLTAHAAQISLRMPDGSFAERTLLEGAGEYTTVSWSESLADLPVANGIWLIAEADLKPMLARVLAIAQDTSNPGQFAISAVEHNPSKYAAIEQNLALEVLPTSIITTAPGTVTDLRVNESLYRMTPALVGSRVTFSWCGTANKYRVTVRGENGIKIEREWTTPSIEFDNLTAGVYDFSVRPIGIFGQVGRSATIRAEMYGKTAPPANVSNFSLAAIAGAAHIGFAPSADLDVIVGGYLRVRHSSSLVGANWNDAVDIGGKISGAAANAVLPLIAGTYLAKWVDSSGFESGDAALVITNAPSVINMNAVARLSESPVFSESRVSLVAEELAGAPALMLDSLATMDEMTSLMDDWPEFPVWGGGVAVAGEYRFAQSLDLGTVRTSRLTAAMSTLAFSSDDKIDAWPLIDDLASIDGDLIGDVSAIVQVRTTDVDPALSQWGDWQPFFVGDWAARAFEFRALLSRGSAMHNIAITELEVSIDMPDLVQSKEGVTCPPAGLHVVFDEQFHAIPALGITAEGMQTGDYFTVSNKTTNGFDIVFYSSSGAAVLRPFDYIARSY